MPGKHGVYEVRSRDGLPVAVGVARADQQPRCAEGETLRVLISGMDATAAARLAAWRQRQVCEWSTGDETKPPPWLRTPPPRSPRQRGRSHGRPVARAWPNGHVELYGSILEAAAALGRDRVVVMRRLSDGRPDFEGCIWRDIETAAAT